MRASDRRKTSGPSEVIEFVPRKELDQAKREIERLQKDNERLKQQSERLQRERERLKQETDRLRRELEAALRASKRQAAPHSRGKPKSNPKRPGRKLGRNYGKQACRPIPSRVDEQISVPLPKCCPHCGGSDVQAESCQAQYQEDIVRKTVVRRFDIAVGRCRGCARQVQGHHPLQTSDAVGVGAVQLGPEALTLAAILNKQMGLSLSLGHTQQVLSYGFGLPGAGTHGPSGGADLCRIGGNCTAEPGEWDG
jgi:exonuclease VII large subunit